jgi:hypothetical protein
MITTDFIIRYTNALYSTPVEYAPRYDEFRDMFSKGQLMSKEWLVRELKLGSDTSVSIAGAWYGTLGALLLSRNNTVKVTFIDIDARCEYFLKNAFWNEPRAKVVTEDMYKFNYTEQIVINTSCEHIPDLRNWLDLLPKGTVVALQSNNYDIISEHINCVYSIEEFKEQAQLKKIFYSGNLDTGIFSRYMLIGIV